MSSRASSQGWSTVASLLGRFRLPRLMLQSLAMLALVHVMPTCALKMRRPPGLAKLERVWHGLQCVAVPPYGVGAAYPTYMWWCGVGWGGFDFDYGAQSSSCSVLFATAATLSAVVL